jgi:phosphatidylinositol glycan class W
LIDYLFCILPLVLALTVLSDWLVTSLFLTSAVSLVLFFITRQPSCVLTFNKSDQTTKPIVNDPSTSLSSKVVKLSIGTCRLWLYLLTTVSILAVDFRVYPRRLAKTETYGVGLMDLGVGLYIVCHAMKLIRNEEDDPLESPLLSPLTCVINS